MKIFFYSLLGCYLVLSTFEFKYQSVLISISREIHGKVFDEIRALLTPKWIGVIQLLSTILLIVLIIWSFFLFNWIVSISILLYGFVLSNLIVPYLPFPSRTYCFNTIIKTLEKEMYRPSNMPFFGDMSELLRIIMNLK